MEKEKFFQLIGELAVYSIEGDTTLDIELDNSSEELVGKITMDFMLKAKEEVNDILRRYEINSIEDFEDIVKKFVELNPAADWIVGQVAYYTEI